VTDRPEARSAAPEGLSPGARPTRTSAPDDELAQWRASWQDELDSAHVYRAIAAGARDDATRELFGRLAQVEEKHSEVGARRLAELGAPVPATGRPTRRARILAALGRRFGARFVLGALAGGEASAGARYRSLGELGVALATDEAAHARSLAALARGRPQAHGERHRLGAGNTLRASVLGANDGLLSNFSLIMGVAGADLSRGSGLGRVTRSPARPGAGWRRDRHR
jgi:hypothetical protein